MNKYLWMAVDPDEYELPIAVEDTAEALAKKYGIGKNNLYNYVRKGYSGRSCGRKYVKVLNDDRDS